MHKHAVYMLATCLGIVSSGGLVESQAGAGLVGVRAFIGDALEFSGPLTGYRVFASEVEDIRLHLVLTNESDAALYFDRAKLQQGIALRYRDDPRLSLDVTWSNDVRFDSEAVTTVAFASTPLLLEAGHNVEWVAIVGRVDGQRFVSGDHTISFQIPNPSGALAHLDGTVWSGRVPPEGTRSVVVRVQAPATPREVSGMHEVVAAAAERNGDLQAALDAYVQAAAVYPDEAGDRVATLALALGRYRQAAAAYEALWARKGSLSRTGLRNLAQAYVGGGDDGNAVRVLRTAGVEDARMATELESLRRAVKR